MRRPRSVATALSAVVAIGCLLAPFVGGVEAQSPQEPQATGAPARSVSPVRVTQLRPPPRSFDPASIAWTARLPSADGEVREWIAAIDGSRLRVLPPDAGSTFAIAPDRAVYHVLLPGDALATKLMLWTPAGTRTLLEPAGCCDMGYAPDLDAVYARLAAPPRGVWRLPLDGGAPRQVLPPRPPDPEGWDSAEHDHIVVSPDGRRIAAGSCSIGSCGPVQLRVPGEDPPWGTVGGKPLGFDSLGNYLYEAGPMGPVRRLVIGGATERLTTRGADSRILRRGRLLASNRRPDGRFETRLRLISLDGGRGSAWVLPGRWSLRPFGGQRYVVLEASVPASPAVTGLRVAWGGHLIFDTTEGWFGYLPPIGTELTPPDLMPATDTVGRNDLDPVNWATLALGFALGLLLWQRRPEGPSWRRCRSVRPRFEGLTR